MLAIADEERALILRMMRESVHAIGGMGDLPGLAAIMAGIEAGALDTLQIHMLSTRTGDKAETILRFQRVFPCLATVAAFENTELVVAKVHHIWIRGIEAQIAHLAVVEPLAPLTAELLFEVQNEFPRLAAVIGAVQTRMPRAPVAVDDGKPGLWQLRMGFDDAAVMVMPVVVPAVGLHTHRFP